MGEKRVVRQTQSGHFDQEPVISARPVRGAIEKGAFVRLTEQTVVVQFFHNMRIWYSHEPSKPRSCFRLNLGMEELSQFFQCAKLLRGSHGLIEARP